MNYNQKDRRRCALLNISGDYTMGGVERFDNLSADTLQTLIDEGFADPDDTQNNSPSLQEILDFIREYPEFKAHGYAVSPERDDYRVSLEGVAGVVERSSDAFSEFVDMFRDADAFEISESGNCYAWYD